MNSAQIMSFARTVLVFVGGWLVSKGYLDNGTLQQLVGTLLSIGAAIWGWYTHQTILVPVNTPPGTTATSPLVSPAGQVFTDKPIAPDKV